jgi:hypothetical protein
MKTLCKLIIETVLLISLGCISTSSSLIETDFPRNRVAILKDTAPGIDAATADAVADAMKRDGFETEFLTVEEVCDPARLSAKKFFLYIVPNAKSYPLAGNDALLSYLKTRGNLLVLGAPPFSNPLWRSNNQWIDATSIREGIARQQPAHIYFDFDEARTSPDANSLIPGEAEIVAGGANESAKCLKLSGTLATNASSLATPHLLWNASIKPNPNAKNDGLVCFWAKGDNNTPQMVIQLTDDKGKSGSARVLLSTHWTYYVLRTVDFLMPNKTDIRTILSNKPAFGVDQVEQLDFNKLKQISLQLNRMTQLVFQGEHTVWLDQIGSAPDPFTAFGEMPQSNLPPIETVAPGYKTYPLTDIKLLKMVDSQGILNSERMKLPVPATVSACYARPEGKGFRCGYKWRWIPLVRAYDSGDVDRGAVVWMLLNQASQQIIPEGFEDAGKRLLGNEPGTLPLEGSVFAVCAVSDDAALQKMSNAGMFSAIAQRISDGLFLSRAGSQHFSYRPGETVQLGAVAVNNGLQRKKVKVRIRICPQNSQNIVFQDEAALDLDAGQYGKQTFEWAPRQFSTDCYIVTTELLSDGKPIDIISHELGILSTEKPSRDDLVTVQGSDFWLHGKKWFPVGVNYWPRYAIGLEADDYVYNWLAPGFYNPEEIERDLKQLESLGANFLAIRANIQQEGRNLLDFLSRCEKHDIKVMLFLQSHNITDDPHYFQGVLMPFHFQEDIVEEFIRSTWLADNPTIFAYDLIWEPAGWVFGGNVRGFGWTDPTPYRQRWDKYWSNWIVDRYNSITDAETDWGMLAPRIGNQVTSPSDEQLSQDGPWRLMVSAYRRFMDDLMSRQWNDAVRKLRRLDPNHLISFRQGNLVSLDFTLTATPKHVDFFSMEGYPYYPCESGTNQAGFTNSYLRFLLKGKPFIWIEYGMNAWDKEFMKPGEQALIVQAKTIEMISKEALENGASGFSPWWWPGGYRVSERSDFGIINADGTSRPSTEIFKKYARLFKTPRLYPEPESWFTIDRDSHAGSYWHIVFHEGADAYKQATEAGKKLGVRTPGTGTNSANTQLVAVGNSKYNGHNPPKYLDAEFNWFKIKVGEGPWIEITDGATIQVPQNKPIMVTASVGNLQDATWLTPASCEGKPGAVYLESTDNSGIKFSKAIIKDTPRLQDADFGESFLLPKGVSVKTLVELQMTAKGRAWFGEKLRFALEPMNDSLQSQLR